MDTLRQVSEWAIMLIPVLMIVLAGLHLRDREWGKGGTLVLGAVLAGLNLLFRHGVIG